MTKKTDSETVDIVLEKEPSGGATVRGNSMSFDHLKEIPKIFCADHDMGKKLMLDMLIVVGALRALETGVVKDPKTYGIVLQNSQRIIGSFGDLLVRDCNITMDEIRELSTMISGNEKENTPKQ